MVLNFLLHVDFVLTFFHVSLLCCAVVVLDAAETAKVIGNRTQKIAARNVRQKRIMTSSRGGSVIRAGEPLSPEQRLTQSHDVSNNSSSSAQPVSERTSSSSSAGISEPQSKETSNKNTDTAVVINTDAETKLSESNCDHATVTDQLEDTTLDLDEQSILTYVLHSCYIHVVYYIII